jgi:nucleoside-diphosphate-sugar epimerase
VSPIVAMTGATGFIGRNLAAHLVARGDTVRAIVRAESGRRPPDGVEVVHAPLAVDALRRAFSGADVVVHLAGVVSTVRDKQFLTVNVDGTRIAAEAALHAGARFVHLSSLAAAGPAAANAPRREDDPPAPINAYGRSKLAGEAAVHSVAGLRWTILRPGVVYGPGDRAVLPLFRFAAHGLMPLVGRPGAAYTFVYVDDMVRAIAAAIDAGAAPSADALTCFVGHPRAVTVGALFEAIRAAVGRNATTLPLPRAVVYPAAVVGDIVGRMMGRPLPINRRRYAEMYAEGFVCRVDRLRERLGVEAAVDLQDGVARTAAWYREQGWLEGPA